MIKYKNENISKYFKKLIIMKRTTFLILCLPIISSLVSLQAQDIIPKPKEYKTNGEVFQLTHDVKILYSGELEAMANYLEESLSPATGWDFAIEKSTTKADNSISILIDNSKNIEKEGTANA